MLVLHVTHLCGIHCHQFSLPSLTVNVFGFSCILYVFIDKRLRHIFKRRSFLRNSIHRIWSTIQPKKIDHNGQILKYLFHMRTTLRASMVRDLLPLSQSTGEFSLRLVWVGDLCMIARHTVQR